MTIKQSWNEKQKGTFSGVGFEPGVSIDGQHATSIATEHYTKLGYCEAYLAASITCHLDL